MFDGLRLASLDEVGNAKFGDCADRAAKGRAVEDAIELFRFLLGHDFHLDCCGTLSRAETESQELASRQKPSQCDDFSVVTIEIVAVATAHACALLLPKMRWRILMSMGDCYQATCELDTNRAGASDDE